MSLREYRRKRDFGRSPEPAGGAAPSDDRQDHHFVVQKHAATRLHYDFRLQSGGVLKSWAVPKGPSLDPAERRLAVEVEDHPLEYASFEGVIPKGEYGGGTVLVWDQGRWVPEGDVEAGLRSGRLSFRLEGEKLRGGWRLVRLRGAAATAGGKPSWLLIKRQDDAARPAGDGEIVDERPESVRTGRSLEQIARSADRTWTRAEGERAAARVDPGTLPGARRAALPAWVEPQLATLVAEAPRGDGWLHELKFDGYRALCRIERGAARLLTRRRQDWTARFRELAEAAAALPARAALIDGEVVALEPDGRSSFQALQRALADGGRLAYFAFDLLHLDGWDLRACGLEQRKQALQALLPPAPDAVLRYGDHVVGGGEAFHREACRRALEGIVAKRRDAPYTPGRGRDWLKVKCVSQQELVIAGFTDPAGSRAELGALLLGFRDQGGLRYAGKVGTGFDAATLRALRRRLRPLEQPEPPLRDPPRGAAAAGAHWVRPELVAQIAFSEWTADGRLRHPRFLGLREDKPPEQVTREVPDEPPTGGRRAAGATAAAVTAVAGASLSHADRVLYPEQGLTKRDLALYYEAVAARMLPHAAERPLTLVRCPRGRQAACFFQKHARGAVPPGLATVAVRERGGQTRDYFMVRDLAGLVALVQRGVLEVHVGGARADALERPDRLVFDLDPGPGVAWDAVVAAAQQVRERLAELGLACWPKTTGGKGLHVVVPLARRNSWDEVAAFTRAIAEAFARERPETYVAVAARARRAGRIYVDALRNTPGATAVAPYSPRARAGAPVATPLAWEELARGIAPAEFHVRSVPERVRRRGDPWAEMDGVRQSLTRALLRKAGVAAGS